MTTPPPDETKPKTTVSTLVNSIGMSFVLIPAGQFTMGCPSSEKGSTFHERPEHRVKITRDFYLGKYEVTQSEYEKVTGKNPSAFRTVPGEDLSRFPVDSISWEDAVLFARKLSALEEENQAKREYRLPTEAEWEYACRAGTTGPFSFGAALSSLDANFDGQHPYGGAPRGNYLRRPTVVGSYKPNAFGLHDMHGNVYEWCSDWFAENFYADTPFEDPLGPEDGPIIRGGRFRIIRGGSWDTIATLCRSGERFYDHAIHRYHDYGFRLVCTKKE